MYGKDYTGKKLLGEKRLDAIRLHRWDVKTKMGSSESRNLAQSSGVLKKLSSNLNIPPVVKEEGAVIYRRLLEKKLVRGRSIGAMSAASLYAACRVHGCNRSLKQFAEATGIRKKDLGRCYRLLVRGLELYAMPIQDPTKYVGKIGSDVGAPLASQARAMKILNEARKKGITVGKDPVGLAGAALYAACYLDCMENRPYAVRKTQGEIADLINMTEVTVRNRYKQLVEVLKLP